MKNTQSKIKPIKSKKELGTTCCLGTNFRPQEVKKTTQQQKIIQRFTD